MRRKTKTVIIFAVIILLFAVFVIVAFVLGRKIINDVYGVKIDRLNKIIDMNKKSVICANRDICAGEKITEDIIVYKEVLIEETTGVFDESGIGSYALIDIPVNTVINYNMVAERIPESDVRYAEYSCFHISSNIHSGDMIDVRIRYQNGEDLIVLSKKTAEKVSYNTSTCFLSVSEKEQLLMASAIYDSAAYNAVMYALVYESPTVQEASKVTYVPSVALAKRIYGESLKSDGKVYNEYGHAIYDIAERSALEDRLNGVSTTRDISNVMTAKDGEQSNNNGAGNEISSGYVEDGADAAEVKK